MPALPQPATLPDAATLIGDAATAAGDSLLDAVVPFVLSHPWAAAVLFTLGLVRLSLPSLRRWADKTTTKIDNRAVDVLGWVLLGIDRRAKAADNDNDTGDDGQA